MKRFSRLLFLAAAVLLATSGNGYVSSGKALVEGTVAKVDEYGGLVASFLPEQLKAAGIEYGDLLELRIGDDLVVSAPYVDAYTESGSMSPCLCNYNRQDVFVSAAMSNGSFAGHIGGKEGDKFVVSIKKKRGYFREYNLLKGAYSYERSDYSSDAVFANFREISTTGIKPGVLYRSTSPINFKSNRVRYRYSAALCRDNGIMTIVDIADSEAKVQEYLSAPESEGSYSRECYNAGNVIAVGSNADYIDSLFMSKLSNAFRKMIDKPVPYLVHCNEGKDRTGFYCLLLEAFCGATADEIKQDYMQTFENLYHQRKNTDKYEITWQKNGFRMLYMMAYPDCWKDVTKIDWPNVSLDGADLAEAAKNYLLMAGLSAEEICALKEKLVKGSDGKDS